MADDDAAPPPACPVSNDGARDAWLRHARDASPPAAAAAPPPPTRPDGGWSWMQALSLSFLWTRSPAPPRPEKLQHQLHQQGHEDDDDDGGLGTTRVRSSIPRSSSLSSSHPWCPVQHGAASCEAESGADAALGHWVYPSEKMFFDAMRRKGYGARAADMKTVVPIHNAVNERAWEHIQQWEAPYLKASKCAGPKLESFANKHDRMTPTARLNTLLGYTAPFDRHDWVINRCGTRIEYVIDFYAGRPGPDGRPGPSFYLDVRPKLNSWEGIKMRVRHWSGLV